MHMNHHQSLALIEFNFTFLLSVINLFAIRYVDLAVFVTLFLYSKWIVIVFLRKNKNKLLPLTRIYAKSEMHFVWLEITNLRSNKMHSQNYKLNASLIQWLHLTSIQIYGWLFSLYFVRLFAVYQFYMLLMLLIE